MNVVFLSPHFPPNFRHFCLRLKEAGANVLALADQWYDSLPNELRSGITEYYRVSDLHNYDELVRAFGYFTHKYGKIDRVDSQNEYWLETEARLRTDFNITGITMKDISKIKRKSEMKRVFIECGLKPARGRVCHTEEEIKQFIDEVGYPVCAKPDTGVGAATTYKIENADQLKQYLSEKPCADYIVEEFITAPIVTYDGLTDREGNCLFSSSLRYSKGVMEAVNEDSDIYYYFVRELEPELEEAGLAALKAFGVKERFFHFEFFMNGNGHVVPMEVNIRPPGGLTLDMFNYANDFDCYKMWAELLVKNNCKAIDKRKYSVMYVGRKDHIGYKLNHQEVLSRYAATLVHHERISGVFAKAIGNYGYILRDTELPPLIKAAEEIQERAAH